MSETKLVSFSYTAEIQKRMFACVMFDKFAFKTYIEILESKFFDNKVLQNFMTIIKKFNQKYNKAPDIAEFAQEMSTLIMLDEKKFPHKEYFDVMDEIFELGKKGDFDYVKNKIKEFAQNRAGAQATLDFAKIDLPKLDFEKMHSRLRKAENIGEAEENLGKSLYGSEKMLEKRLGDRETKYDRNIRAIKTSFSVLDIHMGGGICQPEVGVIMAALKQGKTTVAANFARGAVMSGKDVVFLSFESSEHSTIDTFDAMMTGIPRNKLMDKVDEVKREYKRFFDRPGIGNLQLCHMPAHSASPQTIDSYLYRLETEGGTKTKLLFIDYLSLMRPSDKQIKYDGSSGGRYILFGDIFLELINLANRRDMAIWVLHQAQRGVEEKYKIKGRIGTDDSADSAEICRHADIVLTLNQSIKERDRKPERLVVYAAACRNIEDKWEVHFDYYRNLAQIKEV